MLQAEQVLQERYQLQEKLGQHAGRQTWLAMDLGTHERELVILKLLAFSPQMQWDDFKLFEREAQVLKNLNHPRIPQYRNSFSLDKHIGDGLCWFGLVQDYIPGHSLQQILKQGKRFTEAQVRSYATDILNILIYLHELSPPVLHRDIKPSNLILGEDEQIYLVDFGAVQNQAAVEGVTFTVVGTSGYAPLEQFWGRAVPGSDLYALGATLIHLLTGIAPADLPPKNLRIQFSDKVSLNHNFVRWIEALTEPDIDQRFSTARQALEALTTSRFLRVSTSKISQPTPSSVQISSSPTQLKIKIPGSWKSLINIISFIISRNVKSILVAGSQIGQLLLGLLILGLVVLLLASIQLVFPLFILVPLIFLLGKLWMAVAKDLNRVRDDLKQPRSPLGDYCLYLNREDFVIERRLFGFCSVRHTGKTSNIKDVKQIRFKQITLQTSMVEYGFGQNLTESEQEWLAQEIQDWLH